MLTRNGSVAGERQFWVQVLDQMTTGQDRAMLGLELVHSLWKNRNGGHLANKQHRYGKETYLTFDLVAEVTQQTLDRPGTVEKCQLAVL